MFEENLAILDDLVMEHGDEIRTNDKFRSLYFKQWVTFMNAGKAYLIYCKILAGGLEKVMPSQRESIKQVILQLSAEFRLKAWRAFFSD